MKKRKVAKWKTPLSYKKRGGYKGTGIPRTTTYRGKRYKIKGLVSAKQKKPITKKLAKKYHILHQAYDANIRGKKRTVYAIWVRK